MIGEEEPETAPAPARGRRLPGRLQRSLRRRLPRKAKKAKPKKKLRKRRPGSGRRLGRKSPEEERQAALDSSRKRCEIIE